MKVYISGKITGLDEETYRDRFGRAEALLIMHDYEPVNPVKVVACETEDCHTGETLDNGAYLHHWSCYMKYNIIDMLRCDAILLLPGWQSSRGAKLEMYIAEQCGLRVAELSGKYDSFVGLEMKKL